MTLKKYNEKRDFSSTSEPKGDRKESKNKELKFVLQYHEARAKHFDFRLEFEGVLLSWAVPKGLSLDPKVKRLAVKVEDHPLDYAQFEGVIPAGNYGAGTVEIFDKGCYYPLEDFKRGLKKGHIKIFLKGQKFQGGWSLIKTDEKNWLIVKLDDEFKSKKDLSLKQIEKNEKLPFSRCEVALATLTDKIPKGKSWHFEIKYDGYRMLSYVQKDKARLVSRNGLDYTKKFAAIAKSLARLSHACVLDGEVVAFNEEGRSDFGLLQERIKKGGEVFYVVFDLLALAGRDLRLRPLKERRKILEELLCSPPPNIVLSSAVIDKGKECFNLAKKLKFEGIVAKNINSTYQGKRSEDWLKIKCYKRQEFVIIGYTKTEKNKNMSALLLGYYQDGSLIYVGKVGTGFTEEDRTTLDNMLKKIPLKKPEFKTLEKNAIYVQPKLVAEIQYSELTKEGLLRQPSFIGLRADKDPKDVKLEVAK